MSNKNNNNPLELVASKDPIQETTHYFEIDTHVLPQKQQSVGPFSTNIFGMTYSSIFTEIWDYVKVGFPLFIYTSIIHLVITMIYFHLASLEDPILESSFGIGCAFFELPKTSLISGCYETLGIILSKLYGAGQYRKMSVVLSQGFFLLSMTTFFLS